MVRLLLIVCFVFLSFGAVAAQDSTQADLDEALQDFSADSTAALAVQVTTPESTWVATTGLADDERPTVADDRFRIGSMSKTFVAVVALQLAEEGVFDLDDAASEWLPDEVVERIANADTVTIRQLLSMRSGIEDYLGSEFFDAILDDPTYQWTLLEALAYAYDLPALFEPDAEFYYSNTNYLLVELVIEAAAGEPLYVLTRERIIEPLNLTNTYTQIAETLPGEFVWSYEDVDQDGTEEEVSQVNDGAGLADGGIISTVGDLTTFYEALLLDETLLSEESMEELLDFQTADESGGYSLGLGEYESDWGPAIGHSGAVVGFLSNGVYLPDEEAIIIVLSADMQRDPVELANLVADLVLE
jgi:D-alanyl-D-alanine carboxypeptidase